MMLGELSEDERTLEELKRDNFYFVSTPVPVRRDESRAAEFPLTVTVIVASARQRITCDLMSEYSFESLEVFTMPKQEDKTAAIVTNRLIDLETTMGKPDWNLIGPLFMWNDLELIHPDKAQDRFLDSVQRILLKHQVESSGHIVGEGYLKLLLFTAMLSAEAATKNSPGDVYKYTVWLRDFLKQTGLDDKVQEKGGWNALQMLTEEEMRMIPLNDHKVFQRTRKTKQLLPPKTLKEVLADAEMESFQSSSYLRSLQRDSESSEASEASPEAPWGYDEMSPEPQRTPQMSPQPQRTPQMSPEPQRTPHSTSSTASQKSPYTSAVDDQEEKNGKLSQAFKMHFEEHLFDQRQPPVSSFQAASGPMTTTHKAPTMAENKAAPSPPTLIVITALIRNRIRADTNNPYGQAALNAFYVSPENDHLAAKVCNRVSDSERRLSENERDVLCEEFSRLLTLGDATSFDSEYKASMKRVMQYGSADTLVITSVGILRMLVLTSMLAAEFAKYGQIERAVKFVSLFTMFCCDNQVESWIAARGGWNNLYQEKELYSMDEQQTAQAYATGLYYDSGDLPPGIDEMDNISQKLEAVNIPDSTPGGPYQVPKNTPETQRLGQR